MFSFSSFIFISQEVHSLSDKTSKSTHVLKPISPSLPGLNPIRCFNLHLLFQKCIIKPWPERQNPGHPLGGVLHLLSPATLSEKMVLFHQLPNFPSLASYWNFILKGYQLFPNWQIQMPCLRPYFVEQFHCPPPPFWNAFISLFSRLLRYGPSWFVDWLISFALQMYGFIPSNGL